jgi:hypothetical protein
VYSYNTGCYLLIEWHNYWLLFINASTAATTAANNDTVDGAAANASRAAATVDNVSHYKIYNSIQSLPV